MVYLRIRPFRFFIAESIVILFIVAFLVYRYLALIYDFIDPTAPLPLSPIPMAQYATAAVISNGEPCAKIGTDILQKGGNSVDAAIATMLCESVVCPDLTGLGGGFLMTIYDRYTNSSISINAREVAPAAANTTMFVNDPAKSLKGPLAIAVPGMLQGIWTAYKLYGGRVSWPSLIQPTIQLCEGGIVVSKRLEANIDIAKDLILSTGLKEYFVNFRTDKLMKQGDVYTMPKLGQTLRTISKEGVKAIYGGSLTSLFVNDIKTAGGIITAKDLDDYDVYVEECFEIKLKNGHKLHSGLPPSSGIILAYILRILDGKLPAPTAGLDAVRFMEAFKLAYAEKSRLGDHMFVDASRILAKVSSDIYMACKQNNISDEYMSTADPIFYEADYNYRPVDHGTANIAVLDSKGNAVAVTSTINTVFGSGVVSPNTGIILNNEMNDFSTPGVADFYGFPPSPTNFIKPYKRPMSSMCPTIITDFKGDVVLTIGGAGSEKTILATAYVSALILWYNKTLKEAIEEPRLYYQLRPTRVDYEYGVLKLVVEELRHVGHEVKRMMNKDKSVVTAIHKTPEGLITVMTDFRQQGNVSGY